MALPLSHSACHFSFLIISITRARARNNGRSILYTCEIESIGERIIGDFMQSVIASIILLESACVLWRNVASLKIREKDAAHKGNSTYVR